MSTNGEREPCAKCSKIECVALCCGCQRSFCTRHFIKHRLYLSTEMVGIHEKIDLLEHDLDKDDNKHCLWASVDAWEQQSLRIIQERAAKTRQDLQQWFEGKKHQIKQSLHQINEQLRTSGHTENYTEIDLERWTEHIKGLRQRFETSTNLAIVNDESSSISMIKLIDKALPMSSLSTMKTTSNIDNEHFIKIFGPCHLSDNDRLVTHSSYRAGLSQISGVNHYSTGKHSIKFQVVNKGTKNIFIGIVSSSASIASTFDGSLYGWWNWDHPIVNGESQCNSQDEFIQTGDQLTLILDCDHQEIRLNHHRMKQTVRLSVEINLCPLPWKILVRLLASGDRLRIVQ
jgi:hypothetical protein